VLPDKETLLLGLHCKCPSCRKGDLYKSKLNLALRERCENCGFDLAKNDAADGPAVFLIFILGALLVPMALLLEVTAHPPLWLHGMLWGTLALIMTLGALRPLKAYIIALQYKHRPHDWN
jgi:uncharacterized protein (DUF983 family)